MTWQDINIERERAIAVGGAGLRRSERILSTRRAATSLLIGTGVGAAVGVLFAPGLAVLTGWVAVAGIALTWVWRISWPRGVDGHREDPGAERLRQSRHQPRGS